MEFCSLLPGIPSTSTTLTRGPQSSPLLACWLSSSRCVETEERPLHGGVFAASQKGKRLEEEEEEERRSANRGPDSRP